MDIAGKRAEAKKHRGVSYDARVDRFVAEVWIGGKRNWLGSYHTVLEAAQAYADAKGEAPRTDGLSKAGAALRDLVARMPKDAKGRPVIEDMAEMAVGDRVYVFWGAEFRRVAGRIVPVYRWGTHCEECGSEFGFYSPASPKSLRSLRSRCDEHKRGAVREEPQEYRRLRDGTLATPERLDELQREAARLDAMDLL